jgi:predicted HicB family RNase H-like nuclease
MKDEYDFSNAQRGKFYKPNLRLIPTVRLDPDVLDFLATRAQQRGTTINQLVNQLLKKDIELLEVGSVPRPTRIA